MSLLLKFQSIYRGFRVLFKQFVTPLDNSKYGKLGQFSIVKTNSCIVPSNMFIDDWCVIQDQINFISFKGNLVVRKYSVISSGCTIVPASHRLTVGIPFYLATTNHVNDAEGDVIIAEDCWIGAESILLPNIHIGRGAVVGAGSVVTKDIPPYAVVVGTPARIIASKFTLEQILKHESILYPEEERMKPDELRRLFEQYFQGLRSIGYDDLSNEQMQDVDTLRAKVGMKNYLHV